MLANIGNDAGNSVMVPAGYIADLYQDENLGGANMRVYGAETGEMICVPLQDEGLHSGLSSFTYGRLGHAVGRWQKI